jgi:ABC-type multidrug transport system ATPase subunit
LIQVSIDKLGKRHQNQWIFREVNFNFSGTDKIAIVGFNGSGKSTLLQIISGFQNCSEGKILITENNINIDDNHRYKYFSIGAPYIDIPEELNVTEFINFFAPIKPLKDEIDSSNFAALAQLENTKNKSIKHFSSGMKQRVKLAFAILSKAPVLLLDEPLSNLDSIGEKWYHDLINQYAKDKLVFVASNNIPAEISFCNQTININDYK